MTTEDLLDKAWAATLASALPGTRRLPYEGPAGSDDDVMEIVSQAAHAGILVAAGVQCLLRTGGIVPLPWGEVVAPCGDETLAPCSPQAGDCLQEIALWPGSQQLKKTLLAEWTDLCAASGCHMPAHLLECVFDAFKSNRAMAESIAKVHGERGRWLAGMNPAWRLFARADGNSDIDPQELSHDVRIRTASKLRASGEAELARSQIATWLESSTPKQRVELLSCLHTGLGHDDREILEASLSDKSRDVRRKGTELLGQLAGTQEQSRFVARADKMLGIKKNLVQRLGLTVEPPDGWTKEMATDCIDEPPSNSGARSWCLQGALRLVNPAHWEEKFWLAPADLVKLADGTEWAVPLISAWSEAAVRFRSSAWAKALFGRTLADKSGVAARVVAPALLSVLSASEREGLSLPFIESEDITTLGVIVTGCDHKWSMPFSRKILAALRIITAKLTPDRASELRAVLSDTAVRANPQVADDASGIAMQLETQCLGARAPDWQATANALQLRARMYRAFGTAP